MQLSVSLAQTRRVTENAMSEHMMHSVQKVGNLITLISDKLNSRNDVSNSMEF